MVQAPEQASERVPGQVQISVLARELVTAGQSLTMAPAAVAIEVAALVSAVDAVQETQLAPGPALAQG